MSLKSWKQIYYPVPASAITDSTEAIRHSLQKWRGLTAENLAAHGMRQIFYHIEADDSSLPIDDTSCALCCQQPRDKHGGIICRKCPLAITRGGTPCDVRTEAEAITPYRRWMRDGDPLPMIRALELTLEREAVQP